MPSKHGSFPVVEPWRKMAHRHFMKSGTAVSGKLVPSENGPIREWLLDLSKERSSWGTTFMKDPFRKWGMYRCETNASNASHMPALWILCDNDDTSPTLEFVNARILPLLHDLVTALVQDGVVHPSVFQGSEVVFAAIRKPLRTLPEKHGQPVKPDNINGGLTHTPGHMPSRILVYRVQDAGKVLVHEILHLAGLDEPLQAHGGHAWNPVKEAQAMVAQRYGIITNRHPLGLNESYTEVMACYLHTLWWAACKSSSSSSRIRLENAALSKMQKHIQMVARRVWRHYSHPNGTVEWREHTHCFSYVACRASLWTPPFFKRLLSTYPPGQTPQDPNVYSQLLVESMDSWIAKNRNGTAIRGTPAFGSTIVKPGSLRMTCYE